jgi:hypothetical protein
MKKRFPWRAAVITSMGFALALPAPAAPTPPGFPSPVTYNPVIKIVQGNQPLSTSYVLTITSPANLVAGTPVTVGLGVSVLAKPATGVTDATALSFISMSPASLTFTGPNQQLTTTVAMNVPLGNFAGSYAYQILPAGWPVVGAGITDNGATVNAVVSPPNSTDTSPPAIALLSPANGTVYTYQPATGVPVTVPVSFAASVGTNGQPIDGMQAFINSNPVTLSTAGVLTSSASATGSVQLTAPGSYTVDVMASNTNGTSSTTSTVSVVVSAPLPTITATAPTSGGTYSYVVGTAGATVPVMFSATSVYGNVTSLAATLDGAPVTLSLNGVGSSTSALGSATLSVAATGSHSLVLSAANDYGAAAPVTIPFNVISTLPTPTVSILTPANGATFSRTAGDPPTVVNYVFQGGTPAGNVTSVAVMLDGSPVPATVAGLNSPAVTGNGSLSFSAGGSHTLNVTVSSGSLTASASTTFTVNQTTPPVCENLIWLPPISLNKTIEGGSTMPIKFTLACCNKPVDDTSVLIAIHEIYSDGSTSTPVIHGYGKGSPNPPDYAINGGHYQLNFPTAKGVHDYRIEVYTTASGPAQLLGSKDLFTNGQPGKTGSGGGKGDDEEGDDGEGGSGGD